jgi:hypothetical protein
VSARCNPNPNPHASYGVDKRGLAFELGRTMQKRLLGQTLGRLGISPALLHNKGVKVLVHINPKLDAGFATIKLTAGFLE